MDGTIPLLVLFKRSLMIFRDGIINTSFQFIIIDSEEKTLTAQQGVAHGVFPKHNRINQGVIARRSLWIE